MIGPYEISGEIHMDQSLVHMNFLGKFVWTNGPESSSKVSPSTGIGPWMAPPSRLGGWGRRTDPEIGAVTPKNHSFEPPERWPQSRFKCPKGANEMHLTFCLSWRYPAYRAIPFGCNTAELASHPFPFFLDGGNSALVIGFSSRPILRPQKYYI